MVQKAKLVLKIGICFCEAILMGKMKEIWAMHKEGYSVEYIAKAMKTNTVTIKDIIYPRLAPHSSNLKKGSEEE